MTTRDERKATIEQLEEALRVDDGDAKNFHIREAIQLLHLAGKTVPTDSDSVDEMAK